MPNTGSSIRTSAVHKGPHPKLGMSGGRKPAANSSATGGTAPKAAIGTAKALGPGSNKYTYAERQTPCSQSRSNIATPSLEWLKKVEWARTVLPNYGQPIQEGETAAIPRATRTIGEEM